MEMYLRVNLLGPSPRLMEKKKLQGRGLTKVEKHCLTIFLLLGSCCDRSTPFYYPVFQTTSPVTTTRFPYQHSPSETGYTESNCNTCLKYILFPPVRFVSQCLVIAFEVTFGSKHATNSEP